MKILFVLEHYFPYVGGAEYLFQLLTEELVKKGFSVQVVTTQYDTNLAKYEVREGVEIHRIPCFNRFAFTVLSLPKVIQLAKDCDVIHTTTYNAAFPAKMGGWWCKKPVYITFHEVWGELWQRLPYLSSLERFLFSSYEKFLLSLDFARFIAVSDFTKDCLMNAGIEEDKIERIYNGLDYDKFATYRHQKPQDFVYTFVGRLGVSKGLDLLLPAAAKFQETHPNARFKMIIPQQPKAFFTRIKGMIADLGLGNSVDLLHNLSKSDLLKEICQSSCLLITSYSEGFCFIAAETVAMHVPIISSQQGALKETVGGKMIAMQDMSSEAILEALLQAKEDAWEERERPTYRLQDSVSQYVKLYEN
jgi:glycosyltransferase involved in cell wall biosynthesis